MSILLVDDRPALLKELRQALSAYLEESLIREWVPSAKDGNPQEVFASKVDQKTVLVVTDYDLTASGATGLFGPTIVGWCQLALIPVADFSRGNTGDLPKEPNLFELRVPANAEEAARVITSMYRGFQSIRGALFAQPELLAHKGGIAAVLATMLEKKHLEAPFALYMTRLGSSNSALVQRLLGFVRPEVPAKEDKARVLTYVLGHILSTRSSNFQDPFSQTAHCAPM
jgi:DNA-binding NarL/FixJ family response regulator